VAIFSEESLEMVNTRWARLCGEVRRILSYSALIPLVGFGFGQCRGESVLWQIDSEQSYIRLSIPDQDVPLVSGSPPSPLGLRDYSDDPFTPSTVWTDAGGRKSAVEGTLASNYVVGSSIEFVAGTHNANAVHFGSFRPDPAAWDGTLFEPNTGAPAAFGASVVLAPGQPGSFALGDLALRDLGYDVVGAVGLNPSGGGWVGASSFSVGLKPGTRADIQGIVNYFNEVLDDAVIEENLGGLQIEDLGAGLHRITLAVNVPITFDIDGISLNASVEGAIVATATIAEPAQVVNRFVYHSGFSGSGTPPDNAIDTVKVLAKEGSGPTALSEANLINTSRGVNGVVLDIQGLGNGGALSASDFDVQVSPQGAFDSGANPPAAWAAGPAPSSVTVTAGSPDRIRIEWPNGSITNRWLRLTVKANENTGLTSPESYYIGHLLGETTGLAGSVYTVAFADITPIRSAAGTTVDAGSIADIDKNGTVSFADITAMRSNVGAQLTNITIP